MSGFILSLASLIGIRDKSRLRTAQVVAAVLFCAGTVASFNDLPQALRWPVRVVAAGAIGWLLFRSFQAVRGLSFTRKKALFSLILAAMLYGILSLVCQIFITLMSARDDRIFTRDKTTLVPEARQGLEAMLNGTSFEAYDRELGWTLRPGYNSANIKINSQGVRSLHEYAIPPQDPTKRVLCMGDSFTLGVTVGDNESYPFYAEQKRPGTEWVNLGVSGTCLVQSYLRYRKEARAFGGKYVVIGFLIDDGRRTVNSFRPFLNPMNPLTKPYAKFVDGKFSIEPNPYQSQDNFRTLLANERQEIERLIKRDYLTWSGQVSTRNAILRTAIFMNEALHLERNFRSLLTLPAEKVSNKPKRVGDPYGRAFWEPTSNGFRALTHVFDQYYSDVIADGRTPLIVVIPSPLDVDNHKNKLPRQYAALIQHFKAKGYHFIDFMDRLLELHKDDLSIGKLYPMNHFPASINLELADEIIKALPMP